jgi:hypothetical protein
MADESKNGSRLEYCSKFELELKEMAQNGRLEWKKVANVKSDKSEFNLHGIGVGLVKERIGLVKVS